jgi:hypothetical protein
MNRPKEPAPGFEPGTARLRIGCSTTELSRRDPTPDFEMNSDPKACPKCVQKGTSEEGPSVSGDTSSLTTSHAQQLNRRPLLVQSGVIYGNSRLFNNIARGLSAKLGRKTDSRPPEGVSEVCPAFVRWAHSITNLFRRNRGPLPRDPWKYGGLDLTEKQRQEARQLAADREFDLFVYARGS